MGRREAAEQVNRESVTKGDFALKARGKGRMSSQSPASSSVSAGVLKQQQSSPRAWAGENKPRRRRCAGAQADEAGEEPGARCSKVL